MYLLHTKDKALSFLKVYKNEVEIHIGSRLKTLRTDKGREYYDLVYFQCMGIIHETIVGYTPQSNGVVESKKVLQEMVNSISSYSSLSEAFRGEPMLTDCHILNRFPSKTGKATHYKLWYKRKSNLSYLKVWK